MLYAIAAADRKMYIVRKERHEAREKPTVGEDAVEIAVTIDAEQDVANVAAL